MINYSFIVYAHEYQNCAHKHPITILTKIATKIVPSHRLKPIFTCTSERAVLFLSL